MRNVDRVKKLKEKIILKGADEPNEREEKVEKNLAKMKEKVQIENNFQIEWKRNRWENLINQPSEAIELGRKIRQAEEETRKFERKMKKKMSTNQREEEEKGEVEKNSFQLEWERETRYKIGINKISIKIKMRANEWENNSKFQWEKNWRKIWWEKVFDFFSLSFHRFFFFQLIWFDLLRHFFLSFTMQF